MRRLAVTALVLALLGGTTAAFALTQALKLERSPIVAPKFDRVFSPICACETSRATLSLRLRKADEVDAAIVNEDGDVVRILAQSVERPRGRLIFSWDGHDEDGRVAPDGRYRLRLGFARQRRTIVIPTVVEVDTRPAVVTRVRVQLRAFSPDGDGFNDRLVLVYRTLEPVSPVVFVDGTVRVRGHVFPAGRKVVPWPGQIEGRPVPAGRYSISLAVRDRAGNLSERVRAGLVDVRYADIIQTIVRTRRGGVVRFRVEADAPAVRWAIRTQRGRRIASGTAASGAIAVALPPAARAGRYILRAAVNGRGDEAVLLVLRPRP